MKLAVYSLTRDRLKDTKRAFALLHEMGGHEFDHFVLDNGSTDGTKEYLTTKHDAHRIHFLHLSHDNKGQCIASNMLLDAIGTNYDLILRYDNDIIPQTPNFLRKLIECQRSLGNNAMVSPTIIGLLNPPPSFAEFTNLDHKFDFVEILGGACRLMTTEALKGFRYREHGILSLGEALQVAEHYAKHNYPMAYVKDIQVEHDTAQHFNENAEYFERRKLEALIPYGL